MNVMTSPSASVISLSTALSRSSNSPRYFAPATIEPMSSAISRLFLQALGHVALDDAPGEALDDRGLADAGLADEHRVVLGAARQHLDDAADLLVAADDRVELALAGVLGEVAAVLLERLVLLLGVLAGDAVAAPHLPSAPQHGVVGDAEPTVADLDYHLTTLFPPVRPRRFLEIRYLDSVPDALWPAVVFTLTTLLDDPVAADVAAEATEPVATAWDRAAQIGLGDRRLQDGRHPLRAGRRRTGSRRTRGIDAAAGAFGRTGTLPGRRLLRPGGEARDRRGGHRTGARGAVTRTRDAGARADRRRASARCGWSSSTTPNCAASTTR